MWEITESVSGSSSVVFCFVLIILIMQYLYQLILVVMLFNTTDMLLRT